MKMGMAFAIHFRWYSPAKCAAHIPIHTPGEPERSGLHQLLHPEPRPRPLAGHLRQRQAGGAAEGPLHLPGGEVQDRGLRVGGQGEHQVLPAAELHLRAGVELRHVLRAGLRDRHQHPALHPHQRHRGKYECGMKS